MTMDQQRADVEVLLGLGNDVGVGFDVIIVGIFEEVGMGGFCIEGVVSWFSVHFWGYGERGGDGR